MGIEITGVDELVASLRREGNQKVARLGEKLKKAAYELRDLMRRQAPRDLANLEDAIHLAELPGGRNELGQFQKKEYVVGVDMEATAEGRPPGTTVGAYALEVEHHWVPMGPTPLGPGSELKQLADPAVTVGGGYYERSVEEIRVKYGFDHPSGDRGSFSEEE